MTLRELAARFRGPARSDGKGGLFVFCPTHPDGQKSKRPSLHLTLTADHKLLIFCFAGCDMQGILRAVNLTAKDLMPPTVSATSPPREPRRRLVATYDYRDEMGTLLFQVQRWEPGRQGQSKDFVQRRPDPGRPGHWISNLDGVRRVLYRLPDLKRQRRVVCGEGEKVVEALWQLGIPATTNAMGAGAWPADRTDYFDQLFMAGVTDLVVIPDHDEPGRAHARRVIGGALAYGGFTTIRYVELPGLAEKDDIVEWLAQGHTKDELLSLIEGTEPILEPLPDPAAPDDRTPASLGSHAPVDDPRPLIAVRDLDLRPLRETLWGLLEGANDPPVLFTSGVRLARVRQIPESGRTILDEHTIASFQARLADVARFDAGEKRRRLVAPPYPLVAAMLAEAAPPVPVLTRIVSAPLIAPDGQVVTTTPGYHRGTLTYYAPAPGFDVGTVPESPNASDVAWARGQWLEAVRDFPFATTSDGTHALSAGFLPFGRDLVEGPTPIHLFEAPTWGSGKSLLATAVFSPFLGELDSVQPEPESSAEWRKRLTALLREGTAVAIVDNALDELTAGPLMSFVTSQTYRDRLLGETRTGHYVNRMIVVITGNNPTLSGEALRRTVRVRLVPDVPRPWLRDPATFAHSDLAGWLRQARPALVRAALILWRAWVQAGRPGPGPDTPPFGKFEAWRHVMGGLCKVAGLDGFLGNQRAFYEETTTTDETVNAFVLQWWEQHRDALLVPNPTLFRLAQDAGLGFDARTHQGEVVRFGKWLVRLRDRLFTVSETRWVRVTRTDSSHGGVRRWRLAPVDPMVVPEPDWVRDSTAGDDVGGEADGR